MQYRTPSNKVESVLALELLEQGMELLQYINTNTPVIYICVCGGIGNSRVQYLRTGGRCGKCAENRLREEFLDAGFEILDYAGSTKITYLCKCGEKLIKDMRQWRNNKVCKQCRPTWNFAVNLLPRRPPMRNWKKQLLERDDYRCVRCADSNDLRAHHIEAYIARPDLVEAIDNGVILCLNCHKELHSKYGYNVGLQNLLNELPNEVAMCHL